MRLGTVLINGTARVVAVLDDRFELEIEGVGVLANQIVKEG